MIMGNRFKYFLLFICIAGVSSLNSPWSWECKEQKCSKVETRKGQEERAISLEECQLICSETSGLWPKPSGATTVSTILAPIDPNNIEILTTRANAMTRKAADIFKEQIARRAPKENPEGRSGEKRQLSITISHTEPNEDKLTLQTDEGYNLLIDQDDSRIHVTITSANFFGSRHALETLGQLIAYDDLRNQLKIPLRANITDKPAFPYRGIVLDTSRNYVDLDTIKKTINAMSAVKMNTFHWHMTDSHSFPFVSKSHPELSLYGAYRPDKVYTPENIKDIVEFARVRGVRVLPEFDAPAHVGEGWQKTDYVVCFNAQPWTQYCVEPPCGQFDPTKDGLYDVLEDLYGEMLSQFDPDIFHMGGDEVQFTCWNSTDSIVNWMSNKGWNRTESDFIKLWDVFQNQAVQRLYKKAGRELPVILWTSSLTKKDYVSKYLPKDKYIIQIWTKGDDQDIKDLLNAGYKIIISNYDALYFDCGFGAWVTDGNNWCSPYIGWQKVYENKPIKIAGDKINQVLGSEAALWSEQVDSTSVDSRLWPRAAALAEVLWSNPENSWHEAKKRLQAKTSNSCLI